MSCKGSTGNIGGEFVACAFIRNIPAFRSNRLPSLNFRPGQFQEPASPRLIGISGRNLPEGATPHM